MNSKEIKECYPESHDYYDPEADSDDEKCFIYDEYDTQYDSYEYFKVKDILPTSQTNKEILSYQNKILDEFENIKLSRAKYEYQVYTQHLIFREIEKPENDLVIDIKTVWAIAIQAKKYKDPQINETFWLIFHRGQKDDPSVLPMGGHLNGFNDLIDFWDNYEINWTNLQNAILAKKNQIYYCYVNHDVRLAMPDHVEKLTFEKANINLKKENLLKNILKQVKNKAKNKVPLSEDLLKDDDEIEPKDDKNKNKT